MKPAPLSLDRCFFTKVEINAQSNVKKESCDEFDVVVDPRIFPSSEGENRTWFAIVGVKIVPKGDHLPAYLGEVEMIGGFTVDDSWPDDKIERLVYTNGCGIVYAAIREMVSNVTARGFFPLISLPTVSFLEMYKDYLEARQKAQAQPELKMENSQAATAAHLPPTSP